MNILLILTDEQRADCLGCAGNELLQTPHLDRLAARGFRSTRHSCSTAVCTPSRASIVTGHYARTHGAVSVGYQLTREKRGEGDTVLPTLADYLSEAGYQCGLFGKSHLEAEVTGFADQLAPEQPYYGFQQHALAEDAPFGPYWQWLRREHPDLVDEAMKQVNEEFQGLPYEGQSPQLNAVVPVDIPEELSVNHWITDRTIDFMAQQQQPFCTVCSFVDPHHPWSPVGKYASMYDAADSPTAASAKRPPKRRSLPIQSPAWHG
jgi:arylsulfatase A-like enzyme